ncbi:MAG: hypothetical protein ACTIIT_13910 [Brevibacterium linens]
MSDLNEWIKERRAIHAEAIEEAARAIWDNDDPEGESPNENFEDEPKWSQERYRQSAAAALEASGASATLPALLTAVENVLELLSPHYESQVRREAKFGRKGSACVCEVCRAMEAVEGAINE